MKILYVNILNWDQENPIFLSSANHIVFEHKKLKFRLNIFLFLIIDKNDELSYEIFQISFFMRFLFFINCNFYERRERDMLCRC